MIHQQGGRPARLAVRRRNSAVLSTRYSAAQFKDVYKRARKCGLGVTGITPERREILDLQDAREMLLNSDFSMRPRRC